MTLLKSIATGVDALAAAAQGAIARAEKSFFGVSNALKAGGTKLGVGPRLAGPAEEALRKQVSAELAPRYQRFLAHPTKGLFDTDGKVVGPISLGKTLPQSANPLANTLPGANLIDKRIMDEAKLDYGMQKVREGAAKKRAQWGQGLRGGDVGPGENPIRQVKMDVPPTNNQAADYRALMSGNSRPRVNTNSGIFSIPTGVDSEGFADLMKGQSPRAFGSGPSNVRILGGRTALKSGDFSPLPRSQSEIWQGRAKMGLGLAGAGLGVIGGLNAVSSIASSKPAQLAVSGPSEGFGEEDNLSNAGYSSSQTYLDPRSFRTIGPMSPNRMGASGQLPLALHNLRRG